MPRLDAMSRASEGEDSRIWLPARAEAFADFEGAMLASLVCLIASVTGRDVEATIDALVRALSAVASASKGRVSWLRTIRASF